MKCQNGRVVFTKSNKWAFTFDCPEMGMTLKSMDEFDSAFEAKQAMRAELANIEEIGIEDTEITSDKS